MRRVWISLAVVAAIGAGYVAFPSVYARFCALGKAGGAKAAESGGATNGGATGAFDPTMSSVCQFSCSVGRDVAPEDLVAQPGAKDGDLTRCPVSGVVFAVDANRPRVSHAGHEYVLCCDGCAGKFKSDPARFVASS